MPRDEELLRAEGRRTYMWDKNNTGNFVVDADGGMTAKPAKDRKVSSFTDPRWAKNRAATTKIPFFSKPVAASNGVLTQKGQAARTARTAQAQSGAKSGLSALQEALTRFGPQPQSNLRSIYGDAIEALAAQQAAARGNYDAQMAALRGQYNWEGEDPTARGIRDYALQDLRNQADAARQAVSTSYAGGISASEQAARDALSTGRTLGAEMDAIYAAAADRTRADNASLASLYGADIAALGGGGPVGGLSEQVADASVASGASENALALALGQIASEAQNGWASSMRGQESAQQGQLQRETVARTNDVNMKYGQQEAARRQRELDLYRQAAMQMTGDYNDSVSDFATRSGDLSLQGALGDEERSYAHQEGARQLYSDMMIEEYLSGGQSGPSTVPSVYQPKVSELFAYDGKPVMVSMGRDKDGLEQEVPVDPQAAAALWQGVYQTSRAAARTPEEFESIFAANLLGEQMPREYYEYFRQYRHLPTNAREVSNYAFAPTTPTR